MKAVADCLPRMAQVFPLHLDASSGEDAQASLAVTLAALPDPWTLLRDRRIGDAEPAIDVVLVHPEIGVALVALAPADPSSGVDALAAYLERERFGEFFAGELPIVALAVAPDEVPTVGEKLEEAFAAAPPLAIADKDWADAVIELLLTPDDLTMAPAFGRSPSPPEEAAPPLHDFDTFDDRFSREPREDLSAPLPLAIDWPFGEDRRPRRRGWGIAASLAFLILLGGAGYAAWTYNTEEDQLAEIVPAAPRQVEVPMPPSQSAPEHQPAATKESSSTNTPPPPPPAAAAPAHPPVTLAAKPFAPAPPTPPKPSHVAPLPTAIAKAEPPPAPPSPAPRIPVEQAQSSETPAPTPPPDSAKAIAGNEATRDVPPPKPAPSVAAAGTAAAVASASEPPAPATDAAPPPPPPVKPKPSRIAKSEPPAPKRVAKATRTPPPSETAERAPAKRVANARPEAEPSDHPPFDATDLPPLDGKLTPPQDAEDAPTPRNGGGSEIQDASNAAIGRPTPLFGTQARVTVPASAPAQPQMASASANQRECRPYTSERTLTGRGLPVQGIACRDADGQWRLVSEAPLH
jgi:hypothetical protein